MERYETFGYALAIPVLQSDLYAELDDKQKAECDELIERGMSVMPDCGACPGDGGSCTMACRLAEDSSPVLFKVEVNDE